MKIVDMHCDALYKLQKRKDKASFLNSPYLDVNLERIREGNIFMQAFALFLDPEVPIEEKWTKTLEQVNIFRKQILNCPDVSQLKKWTDLESMETGKIAATLTLEGVEPIGQDLDKLRQLLEWGVLSVGLTWNNANLAADGIEEMRGAGLTRFGKQIIHELNAHQVFTDVSHLSVASFWEALEAAEFPIASHSGAKAVCPHIRNLNDEQIKAMIARDAMIHVVFYPLFITEKDSAEVEEVIRHIIHIAELGGIKNIGFGSDFDGIDRHVKGLENASQYPNLIRALEKYFSPKEIAGFAYQNFINHLPR